MDALSETTEWSNYVVDPGPDTLARLFRRAGGPTDVLLRALAEHERSAGSWRVTQHLALLFLRRGAATEAHYFAHRALIASGDDVLAHVCLARVLEMRTFPLAVLHQLSEIRARLGQLGRGTTEKARVEAYLASAHVRARCYVGDLRSALPWAEFLIRSDCAEPDAFVSLTLAWMRTPIPEGVAIFRAAALRAAEAVGTASTASGRTKSRVMLATRQLLLDVLRRRP